MSQENTPSRHAAMSPPLQFPTRSPGTPLFPLSPERINGSRPPYGSANMPLSPSTLEFIKPTDFELYPTSPKKTAHSRNNSEALVQGMVARFDSLSLKDHQQMHRRDEIAIKRAEMAREMAELELKKVREERDQREDDAKRYREECRRLKKEAEEGRERERKMMKRLEAQVDDIERTAMTTEHQRAVMEKDTRRLRKEAYKTESALVKLQEELKATRNTLRIAQSGLENEKAKSFKREQEAFAAEYKLVGVQEELLKAHQRLQVVEEERDALKTNLEEEEVARIAAEGRIALPACLDDDDEFAAPNKSPRKKSPATESEDKENMAPPKAVELRALREEVGVQRRLRQRAQDQIEFMKMECQFQCCSCRMAERRGGQYVHDSSFENEMQNIKTGLSRELSPPLTDEETEAKLDAMVDEQIVEDAETRNLADETSKPDVTFDDQTGTFRSIARSSLSGNMSQRSQPSPVKEIDSDAVLPTTGVIEIPHDAILDRPSRRDTPMDEEGIQASPRASTPVEQEQINADAEMLSETPHIPHTPRFREVRTVTTTTTIPLAFTPSTPAVAPAAAASAPMTPATIAHLPSRPYPASPGAALRPDGTLDREAALEQIRLRRGRARSVAMGLGTPRKQMIEGIARRDISAPALKGR